MIFMEKLGLNFNLDKLTWQLLIVMLGFVFAIFALIYNDYYIYFGLFTILFGVIGHVVFKCLEWIFREKNDEQKWAWIIHLANILLTTAWFLNLINYYGK